MTINLDNIYDNLFREMYAKLYFYAKRFVNDEDAQDIVEDVFVDLWKRRHSVVFGERIHSFLYCSTYTKCINLLKHQKVSTTHITLIDEINQQRISLMEDVVQGAEHQLECDELHLQIEQAIEELPEKCREVFRLSYLQDLKNEEIARALGLSVRTVEAHIYRALKYLRQRLSHVSFFFLLFFHFL